MGTEEQRGAAASGVESELEQMRWVRGLAAGLVADAGLAEDIAQQTLIAAWRQTGGVQRVSRGWLATVARNVLRQHRRGESRRVLREERAAHDEALPSAAELALRMERQRLLADALTRLAEPYRSTVLLRYSEELSSSEIARRLGLPAGTVRRRLKEGLDRLRAELDQRFAGDRGAWVGALLPFFAPSSVELALAEAGASMTWMWLAGGIALKKAVLAALVVVLAGGVFWLARDEGRGIEREAAVATTGDERDAARAVDPGAPRELEPARAPDEGRSAVAERPSSSAPARVVLAGRIEAPRGAAEDPTLEVFALRAPQFYEQLLGLIEGQAFDDEKRAAWEELFVARAPVGADSRFELELPNDVERVHLALRGRFLYSPETRAAELGPLASDVVLSAKLGACVTGVLKASHPDVPQGALAGVELGLFVQGGTFSPADGILGREFDVELRSARDGSFEFRALPIENVYGVVAQPAAVGGARRFVDELRAGEERALELELSPGATLAGRVRGPDGAPLAGVTVTASFVGLWFGMDRAELRECETDAQGSFTLHAVAVDAPVSVRASRAGYLESVAVELTLAPGEARTGLDFALTTGASIAGRVTWADGAPVAAQEVVVSFDRAHLGGDRALNALRGSWTVATTTVDGRFVASGLGAGPFTVTCAAERDELEHRARRDGVLPSAAELALVLHAPIGFDGRAVDETGAPLMRFRVTCARVVAGSFGDMAFEREELLFEDAAGAFRFEDLVEGRYELFAVADAHVSAAAMTIDVPRAADAAPIELTTQRSCVARGLALDPTGVPIAGARVRLASKIPSWQLALVAGAPARTATTDAVGRFELDALAPGALQLVAEADGFARSTPLELELTPGERVDGLELLLARGATLTGVVYDTEGAPAASWVVNLAHGDQSDARFVTTDAQGGFALDDLAAGTWQIYALHMNRDWDVDEQGVDYGQMVSDLRMASVELASGASEHVVLGEPPRAPVRVAGRVTHGDAGRSGAMIAFQRAEGGEPVLAGVGKDGTYELVVDGGGTYNVSIQSTNQTLGGFDALDYVRDVPEVVEHRLDFALPIGKVAGRVVGADGKPAAGARVSLYADTREVALGERGERFAETVTDADGRYAIDALDAGTYIVQAGGKAFVVGATHARVSRGGIELAAGEVEDDVDFELPAPCTLEVLARDAAGVPVAGATVYARDASGLVLDAIGLVATDALGIVRLEGIAPGLVTLFARTDELASAESAPVRVLDGELERVELTLESGTILWAQLLDDGGEPLRGSIEVYDRDGRDVGNVFPMSELEALYEAGAFSPTRRRFGPLPPGKYDVRATTADGTRLEKSVSLRGQEERTLSLRVRE